MGRIEDTFARLKQAGRTGIIAFLTVGYPDVAATKELASAILDAGADVLELGVPFSDPLAEGTTVQRASHAALASGVTMNACLDVCRTVRQGNPLAPLLLMGYYNPILSRGLDRFADEVAAAGADGLIVIDLPPEEARPLLEVCQPKGVDLIFLLAPTSTARRVEEVSRVASGFIYCVSVTGVTGARASLPSDLPDFLSRVRAHTDLPLAVGFGVSSAEHVRSIGEHAQAAVVGSALINAIEEGEPETRVDAARAFIRGLSPGGCFRGRELVTMLARGIRGAITAEANTKECILANVKELLLAIMRANEIGAGDIACAFFTTTRDLNAEFPAVGARELGWETVPLMCGHEMDVPGALRGVIRVMLMVNTGKSQDQIVHV